MDWLEKKAVQNGFKIFNEETKVVNTEWKIFQKRVENRNVKIKQATFEGILIVTDSDLFKKALINGIGREKAYGMGLLTLIKI
jgi:CRISPR system Cascade subunit CasE